MTILGFLFVVLASGFSGYHYRDVGCVKLTCPKELKWENNVKGATDIQPTTKVEAENSVEPVESK